MSETGRPDAAKNAADTLPLERTLLVLLLIGFFTWLGFAASGYAERHAQLAEEWSAGSTRLVEVTLVEEDRRRLACASDRELGPLHCGYHANQSVRTPVDEANTLQPLNTIKNELFLGAGLWASSFTIPRAGQRFTVACSLHVDGVVKSAALRWGEEAPFKPLEQSVPVGRLTGCVIPP